MHKYSLNQVVLIGRLGMAPEQRETTSGTVIANISLATTTTRKVEFDPDKWEENTEWHKCVAFGKIAQFICNYGDKGRLCNVIGRLQTRKWTDQGGVDHYTTSIVVEQFQFLDKRDQSYQPQCRQPIYPDHQSIPDRDNDNMDIPQDTEDLPF
ncbi:MAG: single-stranded DNA-binding protein [Candidatus Marinimicrobia bacterium]|nr:single-stranded DNA-binding protein [Candidatus Neomarinimicrobiota bacterium]